MRTKLRALTIIGGILIMLPVIYIPTTFIKGILIILGVFVVYISWRLRAENKAKDETITNKVL